MRNLLRAAAYLVLGLSSSCLIPASLPADWSANDYPNFRVQFTDARTGFIIGPRLLRTTDGGRSWEVIEYPRVEDAIRVEGRLEFHKSDVGFVDKDFGWRLSPHEVNSVEYTADGGRSWSAPIKFGENISQRSLCFISREKGWVLGTRKVQRTEDGGKTWNEEPALRGLGLQLPYFLDGQHGWMADEDGALARTTDGGAHWVIERTLPRRVTSIFFITPQRGWAVGRDGMVARTEDGGATWSAQPAAPGLKDPPMLMDVFFKTEELGWISGDDGLILRTADGGRTWARAETPTDAPLPSIHFVDESRGWAVGGFTEPVLGGWKPTNVVLETTDGGQTWKARTFPR